MTREDLARLAASRAHRAHMNAKAAMADFESALGYLDEAIDALGDRKIVQLMPLGYDSLGRPIYPKKSLDKLPDQGGEPAGGALEEGAQIVEQPE